MVRFTSLPAVVFLLAAPVVFGGCFKGAEREKEAPAGFPGGFCLEPEGHCTEGTCNQDRNYCFDPVNPCKGFFCGGSDRGQCIIDTNSEPSCECAPGFENQTFEFYCCPEDGAGYDARCDEARGDASNGGESGGG